MIFRLGVVHIVSSGKKHFNYNLWFTELCATFCNREIYKWCSSSFLKSYLQVLPFSVLCFILPHLIFQFVVEHDKCHKTAQMCFLLMHLEKVKNWLSNTNIWDSKALELSTISGSSPHKTVYVLSCYSAMHPLSTCR